MKIKLICLKNYHGVKERAKNSTLDIDPDMDINIDIDTHTLYILINGILPAISVNKGCHSYQ